MENEQSKLAIENVQEQRGAVCESDHYLVKSQVKIKFHIKRDIETGSIENTYLK